MRDPGERAWTRLILTRAVRAHMTAEKNAAKQQK